MNRVRGLSRLGCFRPDMADLPAAFATLGLPAGKLKWVDAASAESIPTSSIL